MASARHWEQNKDATCYVGNLDERVTDALVWELMIQSGPVINVNLPKDRVTGNHQGYGFVEFRGEVDADYAGKIMNNIRLYGKPIRVNKASADKQKSIEIGAELFVGNLDPMVDERILYESFYRFGQLLQAPKVARDDNGLSKGFGFLSFADFDASDSAVENMNGQFLFNREVSVQYALKKDGKGERHGDATERELAAQAKANNVQLDIQPLPAHLFEQPVAPAPIAPPMMAAGMGPGPRPGMPPAHIDPYSHRPPAYGAPPPRPMPPNLPVAPPGLPQRPPMSNAGYGGPQFPSPFPVGPPPPPGAPGAPPFPPGPFGGPGMSAPPPPMGPPRGLGPPPGMPPGMPPQGYPPQGPPGYPPQGPPGQYGGRR